MRSSRTSIPAARSFPSHPRLALDDKAAFLRRIRDSRQGFSEKQAALADFVLENYDAVAFLTLSQLAREAGVSESTVTRFVAVLGYSGYAEFQRDVQKIIREAITGPERMNLAMSDSGPTSTLDRVIKRAANSLHRLSHSPPRNELQQAAAACTRASRVLVVGLRASAFLAVFFSYHLGKIRPSVEAITSGGTQAVERVATAGPGDLLVAMAFPRYPRETVEILEFARQQRCQTLVITDTPLSPLAMRGGLVLLVPTEVVWYVDAHCGPIVVLTALLGDIASMDRERADNHLRTFERFAEAASVFYRER